ncbi:MULTISPECIES: hypothetical protein [Clostridia]|uniref:hypothetical protein n=1 Tax=Clostridia TaxID=186801 RepID=UPI000EA267C0|nr:MULTISPECIES: hypothetical protein [Clostridia]NBJ71422.1 hypothetical protein [Roseburia sp. 1XD42-34]RKI74639.1 hypothetical protein D7V87_18360 [Clostridium sp. 1xD42-85]
MASEKTKKPSEMNPEDLPDVRAFQDEFTRGFLQSTEETRPGYYPFLSGTGKYEMDFPANGVISERAYSLEKKRFEAIAISDKINSSLIKVNYYSFIDSPSTAMRTLEQRLNMELNFEKKEMESHDIYTAPFQYDEGTYGYVASLISKEKNGEIQIVYSAECNKNKTPCIDAKKKDQEKMRNWLKSINFNQKESEG